MSAGRVYAGHRVKELRARLGMSQAVMGARLAVSVSYLSQIESGDRPITEAVLIRLARAFPSEWADIRPEHDAALLVEALEAGDDPIVPQERVPKEAMSRAVKQQPLVARRLTALHAALRRAHEQLRVLDETFESGSAEGSRLPWEEVRDWFHAESNYIDAIDRRAEAFSEEWLVGDPMRALEERLKRRHGVRVAALEDAAPHLRTFDAQARLLRIDKSQAVESNLFALAHQLMRLEEADGIARVVAESGLASETARQLLDAGVANYAAGALLMPYQRFRVSARALRHDIDRLRQRFGVSFEQACHRLSTLQRPGANGVPFFFCRVDMAGNITKRHSATRMQFARFGGACPLWIVHEAVAIPDRILVQLAETPDGTRYFSMAKGLVKPSGRYDRAPRRYAVALGCEAAHASEFVYADGAHAAATPIGVSCRICPRLDCDQRAFPPAGAVLEIDPDVRAIVPYRFR